MQADRVSAVIPRISDSHKKAEEKRKPQIGVIP
jgi:hypothetical protein